MTGRVSGPSAAALTGLQERLGYVFRDPGLLKLALTHASAETSRSKATIAANERLEFLGDRVLGISMAALLYRRYPESGEGELALRFMALTRGEACVRVARALDLGSCLFLGRGEERSGGRERETILEDSCEALMAAVYLDGGAESADAVVRRLWAPLADEETVSRDAKTMLQEWLLKRGCDIPAYRIVEQRDYGSAPRFLVEVTGGSDRAEGEGSTRREAEQEAARNLLDLLGVPPENGT